MLQVARKWDSSSEGEALDFSEQPEGTSGDSDGGGGGGAAGAGAPTVDLTAKSRVDVDEEVEEEEEEEEEEEDGGEEAAPGGAAGMAAAAAPGPPAAASLRLLEHGRCVLHGGTLSS
jgi:hypothetical protein